MNVKSVVLTILLVAIAAGTYYGLEYKFPNKNEEARELQARAHARVEKRDTLLKEVFSSDSRVKPPGGMAAAMLSNDMEPRNMTGQDPTPSRAALAKVVADAAAKAARDTAQRVAAKTAREAVSQGSTQ